MHILNAHFLMIHLFRSDPPCSQGSAVDSEWAPPWGLSTSLEYQHWLSQGGGTRFLPQRIDQTPGIKHYSPGITRVYPWAPHKHLASTWHPEQMIFADLGIKSL